MTLAVAERVEQLIGSPYPRICPPLPLISDVKAATADAREIGVSYMPWQITAETYIEARAANGRLLYPEVAVIVARQNGKTELLVPHIRRRLLAGRRMMHTAQNRELPREVFGRVAEIMVTYHSDLLAAQPRFANGQEEIRLTNGGRYRIVAPTRGGARGPSNDDVIVDELRELETHDFIAAAKPTMTASPDPQILYLSNAGSEESVVLNALKQRADTDPNLAYLEWSAAPERSADDRLGWAEADPAIGHLPSVLGYLEREYQSNILGGTLAIFETEHLCRWVVTMREPLVQVNLWVAGAASGLVPQRAVMAVSMDPAGKRAAASVAWQRGSDVQTQLLIEATGNPIDPDKFGKEAKKQAAALGITRVGFDPLTDAGLAKYFKSPEPISSGKFANATAHFVTLVEGGRLKHQDAEAVTDDLGFTARKPHDESGSYQAVRAKDDHPIPAVLATIRAVWLASGPTPATPRIY